MPLTYIKTLTLGLDGDQVECQMTTGLLDSDSSEGAETLTTFCESTDVPGKAKWVLHVSGLQDWQAAEGIMSKIHTAFLAGQDGDDDTIPFEFQVGDQVATGDCRPQEDAPMGGDAGSAMTFTSDLSVIGRPEWAAATP
jgi:hypothetical protein